MASVKPVPTATKVRADLDRLFDRLFPTTYFTEPLLPPFPKEMGMTSWSPAVDFAETDEAFVVRMEVPGVYKENLDINLTGDLLTISGKRESTQEAKAETYLWQEREVGTFQRTIRLPAPVIESKVEAHYQDGVLRVTLPKEAPAKASKIVIK